MGYKCDAIFAKESCGHDERMEFGASEAGKLYDGNEATKRLEEGFVKLPKCLKDMLDNIVPKTSDYTKIQTVGFIHSGLQSYLVRADRPTKYITRITKLRSIHLTSDIPQFGNTVPHAIYIAWVIKDIVRQMHEMVFPKENDVDENDTENAQSSVCLENYWNESKEEEDAPERSCSQEERELNLSFHF